MKLFAKKVWNKQDNIYKKFYLQKSQYSTITQKKFLLVKSKFIFKN